MAGRCFAVEPHSGRRDGHLKDALKAGMHFHAAGVRLRWFESAPAQHRIHRLRGFPTGKVSDRHYDPVRIRQTAALHDFLCVFGVYF